MKKTAFTEIHKQLSAKMVEFAGYEMPIQYPGGIINEHKVVRNKVGVFDVTHMGEFEVKGPDALAFIQKCTINDASKLFPGRVQYSAMCYKDGGIVDDLLVYCIEENYYMLVVNASNIDKDFNWLMENKAGFNCDMTNISDEISLLAVQGPEAIKTLQKLTDVNLSEIEFYYFQKGTLAGVDMILSRTGYTGEIGYELYFRGDEELARKVWDAVFEAGAEFGIEPVGLGCRDTLRLEKGYCLYGNDIDQTTNPIEASLGWITKPNKGDFNGKEVIVRTKEEGPKRKLVGIISKSERFIPRHGYDIYSGDKNVGVVTSGNLGPTVGEPIGMAYVAIELTAPGTEIEIEARGKRFPAVVTKIPFI
jgi:aminomethyltransferase